MSKELETLEKLKEHLKYEWIDNLSNTEYYDILKQALHRLEAIENATPSEALKCLESIEDVLWDDDFHYQRHSKLLETIRQYILKAQTKELNDGGRLLNKDLLYLSQCLKQCNDLPLLYVNRTYGNKYVVPQKQFDDLTNESAELKKKARAFEIATRKEVNTKNFSEEIRVLDKNFTYEFYSLEYQNYHYFVKEENKLTEEEFNLMIEVLG